MIVRFMNRIGAFIPNFVKIVIFFMSNSLIILVFFRALLYPEIYANWIYNNAPLVYIIEFLSIHSGSMNIGISKKNIKTFFLIFFYLFFAIVLGFAFHNWMLPAFFILSTSMKIYETMKSPLKNGMNHVLAARIIIFLFVIIFTVLISPFLKIVFPFPATVLQARPPGTSGLFVDIPQTTLVWGIIYFSIYFFINLKGRMKEY